MTTDVIPDFLDRLDDATELLEACKLLTELVNDSLSDNPANASEIAAALNTSIVIQVVADQIRSYRETDWESEVNHAE